MMRGLENEKKNVNRIFQKRLECFLEYLKTFIICEKLLGYFMFQKRYICIWIVF